MEHSIITDEMLRKQDRSTQQHLQNMAVSIAEQNQAYKDKAEDKLHSFYQSEGDKIRGSQQQQSAFENQQSANQWGAFGQMMTSFAGGSGGASGGYQAGMSTNEYMANIINQMSNMDTTSDEYKSLQQQLAQLKNL